ncbi:hypothetical protein [Xenorhabdus szentirmaii]|uniref:Phage tail fibre adhesin Gp38 N-terminal domain-containing protein n=1 Tax=Xenorhabdus szentirmaii DSM 16338 TaxID=1427518 RepID=W1ITC2_9GAMM|nr:hypothetical protein [Xenorhabdus szentirmaii]PHM30597.1 hypothetical protein Xsze_04188 [Xenorhabdus szentirmaii DSM 16338]CDL81073.1 hypothetical protein XSR1_100116 [Xenorhabdus szentirmaii DSM 16338]
MAVQSGNVGSSVVTEFGERSMLVAGAKAGLKPPFAMSAFVNKSAGSIVTFASGTWSDYSDGYADKKQFWGYSGISPHRTILVPDRKIGNISPQLYYKGNQLVFLVVLEYLTDGWNTAEGTYLGFKDYANVGGSLTLRINDQPYVFTGGNHSAGPNDARSPYIYICNNKSINSVIKSGGEKKISVS